MFSDLLKTIEDHASLKFDLASPEIVNYIDNCSPESIIDILSQIGIIPENIIASSTQEKLFSKASDAVLARAFRDLGLEATVLRERADSADVFAKSIHHEYTLVADAKAFRLSRTAKNQKDFKVSALSRWRNDSDYALLCSPYFQYPAKESQIYAQALEGNVCLFSWEHLLFLIEQGIKETPSINLSTIWETSKYYAEHCVVSQMKKNYLPIVDTAVQEMLSPDTESFEAFLMSCKNIISDRATNETEYLKSEIDRIQLYTKEQAISEVIKSRKLDKRMTQIRKYVAGISV